MQFQIVTIVIVALLAGIALIFLLMVLNLTVAVGTLREKPAAAMFSNRCPFLQRNKCQTPLLDLAMI